MPKRKNGFLIIMAMILCASAISGCSTSSGLTKEKATRLIRERYKLPNVENYSIRTGRLFDGEITIDGNQGEYDQKDNLPPAPDPDLYYLNDHGFVSGAHQIQALEEQGYIKIDINNRLLEKEILNRQDETPSQAAEEHSWPDPYYREHRTYKTTVDISITDKGRNIFKQVKKNEWKLDKYEYDIEVTGISLNEDGVTAIVEYKDVAEPLISENMLPLIGGSRTLNTNQKLNMRKWDDGWRIEK